MGGKLCPSQMQNTEMLDVVNQLSSFFLSQQTTNRKYPQWDNISPFGDIKSPIGDNMPNCGLRISESGKAVRETIPNTQLNILFPIRDFKYPIGDFKYPIGDIIPNWVFSSFIPVLGKVSITTIQIQKNVNKLSLFVQKKQKNFSLARMVETDNHVWRRTMLHTVFFCRPRSS